MQILVSQLINEQMYSLIGYLGPKGYQLYALERQSLVQAFWIQPGFVSILLGCPIFEVNEKYAAGGEQQRKN